MSQISEDELSARQRKERKDLLAHIQSLKKSCAKGDKRKKKEVVEESARLEFELDQKHTRELEELGGHEENGEEATTPEDIPMEESSSNVKETRMSKAQKRRNKKANEEKEREDRIVEQEKHNKHGPRNKEIEQIKESLKALGLQIHNIPADGNCLYCAIDHQLEVTGRENHSVPKLRKLTADYMRSHKDDFLPFMTHADEDEIFTEDQYEEYCDTLIKKPVWGGQIEIRALSNALQCPIKVIQANTIPTIQGEQFKGPPLVIVYHRHLYRLGEHYNSTIEQKNEDE